MAITFLVRSRYLQYTTVVLDNIRLLSHKIACWKTCTNYINFFLIILQSGHSRFLSTAWTCLLMMSPSCQPSASAIALMHLVVGFFSLTHKVIPCFLVFISFTMLMIYCCWTCWFGITSIWVLPNTDNMFISTVQVMSCSLKSIQNYVQYIVIGPHTITLHILK